MKILIIILAIVFASCKKEIPFTPFDEGRSEEILCALPSDLSEIYNQADPYLKKNGEYIILGYGVNSIQDLTDPVWKEKYTKQVNDFLNPNQ